MKVSQSVITSRSNPLIKRIAALSEKKGRNSEGMFLAEGEKLTLEAIKCSLPIEYVLVLDSKADRIIPLIRSAFEEGTCRDFEVILVNEGAFGKISTEKAPEGVITVIKYLDFFKDSDIIYKEEFFLSEDERAVCLCSVRDPSNLGAVVRSAAAFGVKHVVLSSDCADVYNPKTVRAAMGSLFKVRITRVSDLSSFVKAAGAVGRRVFAAELRDGAVSVKDMPLLGTDIIMIGNEGHGIPEEVSRLCHGSLYIPISENIESLNASVAAAVFMWEQNK